MDAESATHRPLEVSERVMLSKTIHDDVMQTLAACVLASDLASRYGREGRTEELLQELGAIRDGVDMAIASLRCMLNELRAPV